MKLETKAPVQSRFATPASASPSDGRDEVLLTAKN